MMIGLLRDAMLHYSGAFQRDREEAGLTIDQGRVLLALERQPGIDLDTIARRCFLSFEETEVTLRALTAGLRVNTLRQHRGAAASRKGAAGRLTQARVCLRSAAVL